MVQQRRRIAIYFGSLVALTAAYTALYRWGMATWEGETRTWYESVEIVVQSMTTTGYGQDAPWETLQMTALVVLAQLTGIAYIFVAFPVFVVPWLQSALQPTPPTQADDIDDHVVVVGYTELCGSLVDELAVGETPYVVLEGDEEVAQSLHDDDVNVVHGDPTTDDALEAVEVDAARAVVLDVTEQEFVSTILALDERDLPAMLLALVEDQSRGRYLRYAGVDEVLSPEHRLGKTLGDKVRGVVEVDPDVELGEELQITEHPIDRDSQFFDVTLDRCRRLEETGATVLGAWTRGDFTAALSPNVHTDESTSLLVAGTETQIHAVAEQVGSEGRPHRPTPDPVLVVGSGAVGATAIGGLGRAGLDTTLVSETSGAQIDAVEEPESGERLYEPDVVGDPTIEETYQEAGIEDARTVVVALGDDDATMLSALVARALAPDARILAAIHRSENASRLRAAGVDYVLGLPNVAGRMVTLTIAEEDVMPFDDRLHVVEVDATPLVDEQIDLRAIRAETDCSVLALERDGRLLSDVEDCVVQSGDAPVVAGAEEALEELRARLDEFAADA